MGIMGQRYFSQHTDTRAEREAVSELTPIDPVR
jgi:hypothetical protein